MKIETILNAHEEVILLAFNLVDDTDPKNVQEYQRLLRQARAFRTRILRMGNDSEEAYYSGVSAGLEVSETTMAVKDAEIDKLMELAIVVDRLRKQRMNTDYLDAMDMAKMIVKERKQ